MRPPTLLHHLSCTFFLILSFSCVSGRMIFRKSLTAEEDATGDLLLSEPNYTPINISAHTPDSYPVFADPQSDNGRTKAFRDRDVSDDFDFTPGTNLNAPGITRKPGLSLGPVNIDNRKSSISLFHSEPSTRADNCTGKLPFVSVLGGNYCDPLIQPTQGTLLPSDSILLTRDIRQGSIGDCGFGAALRTMILTGRQKILQKRFHVAASPSKLDVHLQANFIGYKAGKITPIVVNIDDGLSYVCSANNKKPKTIFSFRPSIDRVPCYWGSLFEKAFAKFVDAYSTEYRFESERPPSKRPEEWGINGLEGVQSGKVLQALIGGTAKTMLRDNGNGTPNPKFLQRLQDCVDHNVPCSLATFSIKDVDGDGTEHLILHGFPKNRKFLDPKNKKTGGQSASLNYGDWTIQHIINAKTGEVGTYFKIIHTSTGKETAFVGDHYYALSRSNTPGFIHISNPWGSDILPDGTKSTTFGGGLAMPIQLAAKVFYSVEYIGCSKERSCV